MCEKDQFGRLPGESLGDAIAREAGERVGARLDLSTARVLQRYCAANRCNTSEGIRRALKMLANESGDAEKTLDDVARALGLDPKQTDVQGLIAKIQALAAELETATDPTDEPAAAPPPPRTFSATTDEAAVELTAHERELIAKTPADKRAALTARLTAKNRERVAAAKRASDDKATNAARNRARGHKY